MNSPREQLTEEPPDTTVCAAGFGFCSGSFWKLWVQGPGSLEFTWKTDKPERVPHAAKWWCAGGTYRSVSQRELQHFLTNSIWPQPRVRGAFLASECFNREGQVLFKPVLRWCLYKSQIKSIASNSGIWFYYNTTKGSVYLLTWIPNCPMQVSSHKKNLC